MVNARVQIILWGTHFHCYLMMIHPHLKCREKLRGGGGSLFSVPPNAVKRQMATAGWGGGGACT